jgi:hypothetical protein
MNLLEPAEWLELLVDPLAARHSSRLLVRPRTSLLPQRSKP